jgi:hypothetical protein
VSGLFVLWQKVCENQASQEKQTAGKKRNMEEEDGRSSGGKKNSKNSLAGRMGSSDRIALSGTRAAGRAEACGLVTATP